MRGCNSSRSERLVIELPYPADWKTRPEYVRDRIVRMKRAWYFCKGRAADLRPLVEEEIERLEKLLSQLEGGTWAIYCDDI